MGPTPPRVEADAFKGVMAQWPKGVTIATTRHAGAPVGMTVSSFTGVSLHPPQVLICVSRQANTHAAIVESGYFAVNLLAAGQQEWGMRFADPQSAVGDRFAGIAWFTARTGAPILPGVLGWLDCSLYHAFAGGDHTIFVGEITACEMGSTSAPLIYYRRDWWRLAEPVYLQKA